MTPQTQTKKSERRNQITVLGFVLIGICFVAYFILAIVSKWTHWNYLVGMSPLFTALLVCLVLLAYYFKDIEQARKAAEANRERIRNASVSTPAGIFLLNLENKGFKRLAWQIRKKAVDGDELVKALVEKTWNSLQRPDLFWESNQVIQAFLSMFDTGGDYFGYRYAQGVLVGLAQNQIGLLSSRRIFMISMMQLLYPDLKEWELFRPRNKTEGLVKDS